MQQLLIATRNKGKMKEIRTLLTGLPIEVKSLEDLNISDEIEETGKSYEENAILKAKTIGNKYNLVTLGEDSGLEIDALDGWPGLHSARHTKGTDDDRIDKILKKLSGVPKNRRTARYKAVIALYYPSTKSVQTFEGVAKGYIPGERIGKNGFGYDPIFWSIDLNKTFAEADDEEKNRVSHRAQALLRCQKLLRKL